MHNLNLESEKGSRFLMLTILIYI